MRSVSERRQYPHETMKSLLVTVKQSFLEILEFLTVVNLQIQTCIHHLKDRQGKQDVVLECIPRVGELEALKL